MKFITGFIFALMILGALSMTSYAQDKAKDQKAIKDEAFKFEKTWNDHNNDHNMDAMFDLFIEDAEWVNIVGMYWVGRADVKKAHQDFHATMFKNTPLKIDEITIRKITSDTAVAVLNLSMGDFTTPSGETIKNSKDRLSLILVRQKGRWLIAHGHNTVLDMRAAQSNPIKK